MAMDGDTPPILYYQVHPMSELLAPLTGIPTPDQFRTTLNQPWRVYRDGQFLAPITLVSVTEKPRFKNTKPMILTLHGAVDQWFPQGVYDVEIDGLGRMDNLLVVPRNLEPGTTGGEPEPFYISFC
jgi:hypothetical protein